MSSERNETEPPKEISMKNLFTMFFKIPGFDEEAFMTEAGLDYYQAEALGFRGCQDGTGGFTVFRKENELGGFDYLPFVDRFYPGNLPEVNPAKDRWLEGYDGVVLFVLGAPQNRQYVRHGQDGAVTKNVPIF